MNPLVDRLIKILQKHSVVKNVRVVNYDETPHYPHITTSPHHFHDESNNVGKSFLTGAVEEDLKKVLLEIEKWLTVNI